MPNLDPVFKDEEADKLLMELVETAAELGDPVYKKVLEDTLSVFEPE